jgi:hypothetical protein
MMIDTPDLDQYMEAAGLSFRALETNSSIMYILEGDSRIIFCNESWDRFALQNAGSHLDHISVLGTSVMDVAPGILRPYYANLFAKARTSGQIMEHEIEMSSPEMFRLYCMRVLPIGGPYLCIESTRCVERPQERACALRFKTPSDCEDESGHVTICCNCRRTQRTTGTIDADWEFVPEFLVIPPPRVRDNLCPTCWAQHYPGDRV